MRAAADDGTAMLAPMATFGLVPAAAATVFDLRITAVTRPSDIVGMSRRPIPPDPPPPRG